MIKTILINLLSVHIDGIVVHVVLSHEVIGDGNSSLIHELDLDGLEVHLGIRLFLGLEEVQIIQILQVPLLFLPLIEVLDVSLGQQFEPYLQQLFGDLDDVRGELVGDQVLLLANVGTVLIVDSEILVALVETLLIVQVGGVQEVGFDDFQFRVAINHVGDGNKQVSKGLQSVHLELEEVEELPAVRDVHFDFLLSEKVAFVRIADGADQIGEIENGVVSVPPNLALNVEHLVLKEIKQFIESLLSAFT